MLWRKLAAQGYTGIIFDEEYGGVGLGMVELVLLMEEAGRALLPGPLFSTVALAGAVIDAWPPPSRRRNTLRQSAVATRARRSRFLESSASWDLGDVEMTAAGGKLTGEKLFVLRRRDCRLDRGARARRGASGDARARPA